MRMKTTRRSTIRIKIRILRGGQVFSSQIRARIPEVNHIRADYTSRRARRASRNKIVVIHNRQC